MAAKVNNPPAFASCSDASYNDGVSQEGMTLRDYFAAAALTGAIARPDTNTPQASVARACYMLADAMLLEREKG